MPYASMSLGAIIGQSFPSQGSQPSPSQGGGTSPQLATIALVILDPEYSPVHINLKVANPSIALVL